MGLNILKSLGMSTTDHRPAVRILVEGIRGVREICEGLRLLAHRSWMFYNSIKLLAQLTGMESSKNKNRIYQAVLK